MATFYLLPPRPVVAQHFCTFLSALFPGLAWPHRNWSDLAESLGEAARSHPDVYVIYREDLTDEDNPALSLLRDFGATAGDEVVEVAGSRDIHRWRLPAL